MDRFRLDSEIEHLEKCAKTMLNWLNGILNSFLTPITNGFTEGCNNKIKVLKGMLMVIKILIDFVTVFYICFHYKSKNK